MECLIHRPSATLLALWLAATGAAAQGGPSFLINGDFESGDDGVPSSWSRSLYPGGREAGECLARSSERARSGGWALRIDTEPVLSEEVSLVFNGAVAAEAAAATDGRLELSGWVYIEPGTAVRPFGMRLRCFGPNETGRTAFVGDVLELKVLGEPGEWTEFRASGAVPKAQITSMDLHCSIRPDVVRTVQFLDDVAVSARAHPDLEARLQRSSIWRDEGVLAVDTKLNDEQVEGARLVFLLLDADGREVAKWERDPASGGFGLDLPERLLPEGAYRLRTELRREREATSASAEARLELAASPWERAPDRLPGGRRLTAEVECFSAMGTVAPSDLADAIDERPEPLSADLATGDWERRGYVAFHRHPLDPVPRLGRPRPGELGPIRLFACPGEYESATLSVWALRQQPAVAIDIGDLKGEADTIAPDCIDIRAVRRIQGLPSFLEARPSVQIVEGQTQTYWLTCYIPPEATPGFYQGTVTVRPADAPSSTIPLVVWVLPLKLPPPEKGYGFWWKMDGRWNGYYSQDHQLALDQIRRQFILLREHGCNMASCYGMPKITKAPDGRLQYDFEQDHWGHNRYSLADFLRLGRQTGFLSADHPIQYPGADSLHSDWIARAVGLDAESAEFDDFYREACRRVDEWAKQQGFELAFACIDEIGNSEERRRDALRFYRVATEAGVLTSVTDNSMHGGVHLMGQPRFDDIIAVRLCNFITPEMIDHARGSADRLWLYNLASGGWSAKRDRFVFGLLTERCGAEGCAQWAFQWPPGNTDPYEAAAAGERTGYHYALPAPDGPLPTVALAGVREGIDDARYLALLKARAPGSSAAALDAVPRVSVAIPEYLEAHDANSFDVWRWRMAQAVMQGK
jgi:hypothetical protein